MVSTLCRATLHLPTLKTNIAFVGKNGHLQNDIDLAGSGFEWHESRNTKSQLIPGRGRAWENLKHLDRLLSPTRQGRIEIGFAGPEGLDAMKVDNILPQKIDSPYTTRSTWLAQKALRGLKVATPSLNWISLSSALGHGVCVLASSRLQFLGYATGNSPSWASRGDNWPLLRGHNIVLILRSAGPYSPMAKSFPHLRSVSDYARF